ncbi:MAG: PadR family transcriptional regulator [Oscillospiraceae bacterium]|jgi:PadR family transcriptional regulator PadR|nr:PadR family transcriptional regulator [Oscillospiraceae bacterium]
MAFHAQLLDACVLANIAKSDAYGYTLTQNLKDVVNVSESTLYPVLRRLQSDAMLTYYDQPYQGRNRRYYSITESGRQQLKEFSQQWIIFRDKVNELLDPFYQLPASGSQAIALKGDDSNVQIAVS